MTFQVGQIIPASDAWHRRGIFVPGDARWHALTVPAMAEDRAEAWLALRGVYAFHPVKRRASRIRGKLIERKQRYLPGYVFARFPGPAIRHRVTACPFITGAVSLPDGQWGVLDPGDLRKLHAMRGVDDAKEQARASAARINRGDRVRVLTGLVGDGQEVEVMEVSAGKVKFRLRMFGADVPAEAMLANVEKVG